jgi:sortase (surface protein transpeptidase)
LSRKLLPGLAAALLAAGAGLLAVACTHPARQYASVIPSSVSTAPPASPAPAASPAPGFAARSVPLRIIIPAIGVNAPVMELGLNADGSLAVPPLEDHNLAGWYEHGPSPGQQGPAVIAGHIDSTTGESVFYRLRYLKPGDRVSVTLADDQVAIFSVTGLQQTAKTTFPTSEVYGHLSYAGLRLITCGGAFDYSTGHYLENIIVFARAVSS